MAQAEALTTEAPAFPAVLRWAFYAVLIAITVGGTTANVMNVRSASRADPSPFLSANDKSRWATVKALVDHGTYAIDDVIFHKGGSRNKVWHSIDIVRHKSSDGKWHYYSSKPTLLATIMAGEYWVIKTFTGATLDDKPFYVVRLMLLLTNVIPLGLALVALAWLAELYGMTDWGRLFVVASACAGTFMTTFAVALNNHLPAAICVSFALACFLPICWQRQEEWWRFLGAGLFAALTAAFELPGLTFFVVVMALLAQRSPVQTLLWFLPPALLVAAGSIGTNYLAHDTWKPPYAHRSDGKVLATLKTEEWEKSLQPGELPSDFREVITAAGVPLSPRSQLATTAKENRWVLVDTSDEERYAVVLKDDQIRIHQWQNWYEFDRSYWSSGKLQGVDRGEKSVPIYLLHCLIGHHGLFSLTPIWLLALVGLAVAAAGRDRDWQHLAGMVLLVSAVVLVFYFTRPLIDRNYGGVTCCLRWALWMAPMWLVAMLPAADVASESRTARWISLALLAVSAFSATYSSLNPFSHPWLFEYWSYLGWIKY